MKNHELIWHAGLNRLPLSFHPLVDNATTMVSQA